MALSKKTVGVIIALIVLSLAGLVVLQMLLVTYAMNLKEQAFHRNVMAVLGQVSQKLAAREVITLALNTGDSTGMRLISTVHDSMDGDSLRVFCTDQMIYVNQDSIPDSAIWADRGSLHYSVAAPQHVTVQAYDVEFGQDLIVVDTFRLPGEYEIDISGDKFARGRFLWRYKTDSLTVMMEMINGEPTESTRPATSDSARAYQVTGLFDKLLSSHQKPLEERVNAHLLDSLIAQSLGESDMALDYGFGIWDERIDSLKFATPAALRNEIVASRFSAPLFPVQFFSEPIRLHIYFPGQRAYLWQQTGPLLALTLAFITIIVGCFAYTIRTILRQRQFAARMVDFINNMTHEFKTPISTVRLACQAIERPDILGDNDKILRYNDMIQNENRRMSNQAEKILQMAVLEEGDYDLKIADVDVHQIIAAACGSEGIHVENRHGRLLQRLEADRHIIRADAVHVTGIITNLLDNANKYSPQAPDITVATANTNGDIMIAVSDRGQGIPKAQQKNVFDKYFRVSSGDRHDVKGFGLGLSFVKLMTVAMNGRITLISEPGRGTTVELRFPVVRRAGEAL